MVNPCTWTKLFQSVHVIFPDFFVFVSLLSEVMVSSVSMIAPANMDYYQEVERILKCVKLELDDT